MYIDKRRKTVTLNDIRAQIAEEWPTRQQLPLSYMVLHDAPCLWLVTMVEDLKDFNKSIAERRTRGASSDKERGIDPSI